MAVLSRVVVSCSQLVWANLRLSASPVDGAGFGRLAEAGSGFSLNVGMREGGRTLLGISCRWFMGFASFFSLPGTSQGERESRLGGQSTCHLGENWQDQNTLLHYTPVN